MDGYAKLEEAMGRKRWLLVELDKIQVTINELVDDAEAQLARAREMAA